MNETEGINTFIDYKFVYLPVLEIPLSMTLMYTYGRKRI